MTRQAGRLRKSKPITNYFWYGILLLVAEHHLRLNNIALNILSSFGITMSDATKQNSGIFTMYIIRSETTLYI